RFADPTWSDNPAFYAIRQAHLATSRLVSDLLEAGSGNAVDDAKAALATGFLMDALAPTHFLLTNPAPPKRRFATGGRPPAPGGPATSWTTCSITRAGRARSTPGRSGSARPSPPPRARSCSRTS